MAADDNQADRMARLADTFDTMELEEVEAVIGALSVEDNLVLSAINGQKALSHRERHEMLEVKLEAERALEDYARRRAGAAGDTEMIAELAPLVYRAKDAGLDDEEIAYCLENY